jgi:DNA-binding MarR family transcriptional regulator
LDLQRTAHLGGLERSEHSVLTMLWLAGPDHYLSPTQLSHLIVQTTGGMTKTLRRLERAGMVERIPDPGDGRRQLIHLTAAGSRLIERHVRQMFDRWEARLQRLPRSERAPLASTLWSFLIMVEESFIGSVALAAPRLSDRHRTGNPPPRRTRT